MTSNRCTQGPDQLPERYCLDVIRDFIAAHWDDFSSYAKVCEVDPDAVYQQIGGQNDD